MKTIIVASTNPAKIEAVRLGFAKAFPEESFIIEGVSVPSGVSDQPMSDEETLQGAENRANNAHAAKPDADFWVGLEGGLQDTEHGMMSTPWVCIQHGEKIGRGGTGRYFLPEAVAKLVREGKELGEADDIVFGRTNSKQSEGAIGLLSRGLYSRAGFYSEAVVLALLPFTNEELYDKN